MWKRCPNGAYVEIKYDGERLQAHKKGDEWSWYSRNLKTPKEDKVSQSLGCLLSPNNAICS